MKNRLIVAAIGIPALAEFQRRDRRFGGVK